MPIPKKDNAKECSSYHSIALISHASKVILKILQAKLQQYVNYELPGAQDGFRKGRGTRDQIAKIRWIIEKWESSRETSTFALLTVPNFDCVDNNKLWKILNFYRWEYHTTWPASWEICIQVRNQQLEQDMEEQTGSR